MLWPTTPRGYAIEECDEGQQETGEGDLDLVDSNADRQKRQADNRADDRPRIATPLARAGIDTSNSGRKLRIVGIERSLDLLEHTLLVLRERHDALPTTSHLRTS